jgi:hypothetical protein
VIELPINDRKCLTGVTDVVRQLVASRDPQLVEIAQRVGTTAALVEWIRSLPQRDDDGDPTDGPKVNECTPPQRLIIPSNAPNCVERTGLYIAVGELLDPEPVRQMATIDTPAGRHTFPLENGEPVVLDPEVTRNTLAGGLFQLDPSAIVVTPNDAVDWIATLAEEPATARGELHKVRNARSAMRHVMEGKPISRRSLDDVAHTVSLAAAEAPKFGKRGRVLHHQTARKLANALAAQRRRRNAGLELKIGGLRLKPDMNVLGALGRIGGRLGLQVGSALLQGELSKLGIGIGVLSELENQLNGEGLSLGVLAAPPPPPGSLAALTKDAILAAALHDPKAKPAVAAPRNASWLAVKTPGVIHDEMMTTDNAIRALGADIDTTFRRPFEQQLAQASARFDKQYGRKPGVGRDATSNDDAQVYAWMTPVPTAADIEHKSYQGAFVYQWGEFEKEWDGFLGSHEHWYDRMWKGDYDKAIEFRERTINWRDQFQQLGGKPTSPVPTLPPPDGPIPWKSIITVAGIGAAALVVPELLRTMRSGRSTTSAVAT